MPAMKAVPVDFAPSRDDPMAPRKAYHLLWTLWYHGAAGCLFDEPNLSREAGMWLLCALLL